MLIFNTEKIKNIEFGVGQKNGDDHLFFAVPVDKQVKSALCEVVQTTWQMMRENIQEPAKYEPSEKYESVEYLYLDINDPLATLLCMLHEANNLQLNANALRNPTEITCYFARLTDEDNNRLTALRTARQFKGILKKRLIRFTNDTLKIIEDQVFKLDSDFDLLIDSKHIHIWRPRAFESICTLNHAILEAVPNNVQQIQHDIPYVDLSSVQEYASKHPRAARYVASIRSQNRSKNIDKNALENLCKGTMVELRNFNGKLTVADGHVIGFLEVLDRRRYQLELIQNTPEQYRAYSRQKIAE